MMAVVKIGQIKTTLGNALHYISNPSKTQDGQLVSTNYLPTPVIITKAETGRAETIQADWV